jgi:uncharacterized membrane protein YhiD involved in acid resistance
MNELSSTWEQYLTNTDAPISAIDFGTGLILTVIAAYAVKLVYTSHGQSLSNRRAFGNLFIPLALTTMVVITIVKSSLALSLGLVGALSIVRFRAAIKEPEELVFLFVSIMIGLGFGANQVIITLLGTAFLLLALVSFRKLSNTSLDNNAMFLTISKTNKGSLNSKKITEIVGEYAVDVDLKRMEQTPVSSELAFVTSFIKSSDLTDLQDRLLEEDNALEIRFLDTSKVI